MEADAILDCVGLYCPMPVAETARKLKELKVGEVLELLADDEGVKVDIPSWCRITGNEFVGMEEKDGEYRMYIRRKK